MEESDQITHLISLDDELKGDQTLDVFKVDPDFEANENKWVALLC